MFLYGLRDSTQCILIDISISCYQLFVVYLFVDVKINLIQCQCQYTILYNYIVDYIVYNCAVRV